MKRAMFRELLIALSIVAVCVVIHTTGLVLFAQVLIKRASSPLYIAKMRHQTPVLILVFAVVVSLHLVEAALWAWFYYLRSLFPDFETSLYFSLVTYGSIGYGDVVLPQRWRLLSAIEGISGVLLCGLSGGFVFAVINSMFQTRMQQRSASTQNADQPKTV